MIAQKANESTLRNEIISELKAVEMLPSFEGLLTTLKNSTDDVFRAFRIYGPTVPDNRIFALRSKRDEQLGVTEHRDIGVVCDHNDLALFFGTSEGTDKRRVNEFTIEVVLGLVNDEWCRTLGKKKYR